MIKTPDVNTILEKIRAQQRFGDMPRYVRGKYNAICIKHPFEKAPADMTPAWKAYLDHCFANDQDPDYGPPAEDFDAFFNTRHLAEEWCAWHTLNGYEYKLYSIETITKMYAEWVADMEALEKRIKE
jgi:hypothetical protein